MNPDYQGNQVAMSVDTPVIIPSQLLLAMIEHRLKAYRAGAEINDLDYEELQTLTAIQRIAKDHDYFKVGPG